eukprot:GHVT01004672.1.p1 GENE.GHVT01004672.1~~GHVT01004672.1.p1  ORF type:complete len:156 (+),score=1.96 GHVT01004672.1:1472-1939(+)
MQLTHEGKRVLNVVGFTTVKCSNEKAIWSWQQSSAEKQRNVTFEKPKLFACLVGGAGWVFQAAIPKLGSFLLTPHLSFPPLCTHYPINQTVVGISQIATRCFTSRDPVSPFLFRFAASLEAENSRLNYKPSSLEHRRLFKMSQSLTMRHGVNSRF